MIHTIDYTIQRIRDFRKSMGYARFRLATLADLSENAVRKMDSKNWNPTLETLKKLESLIPPDFTPPKSGKHRSN